MKLAAVICEYNPFHRGHRRHLALTREAGASHIVCLMSGSVVQRGDIAIYAAQSRAKEAVKNGADLVLEMQPQISLAPARDFAKGCVDVIARLGAVEMLSFGAETACAEKLSDLSDKIAENELKIKSLVSKGRTYPQAAAELIGSGFADLLTPNNTLALEYLRALKDRGAPISPVAVERNNRHDGFASASFIRSEIRENRDPGGLLCGEISEEPALWENAERAILYRLSTMSEDDFRRLPYCFELAPRLYRASRRASSLFEIYDSAKSRNFTLSRVRRAVFSAAIGLTEDDLKPQEFARVLAMNKRGAEILKEIKSASKIAIGGSLKELSKISPEAERQAELIETASVLRTMGTKSARGISEFKQSAVMLKNE